MKTIIFDIDMLDALACNLGEDLMNLFLHAGFMLVSIEGANRFVSFCADEEYDGIVQEVNQFVANRLSKCFVEDEK